MRLEKIQLDYIYLRNIFILIWFCMLTAQIYTVYVVVDDYGYVYNNVSGEQFYVNGFTTVTVRNVTAPRVIAINVINTSGKGGFMMTLSHRGCLTNHTGWKCTDTVQSNWYSVSLNDSNWQPAVANNYNSGGPYIFQTSFSDTCPYVSFTDKYAGSVYCRLSIS